MRTSGVLFCGCVASRIPYNGRMSVSSRFPFPSHPWGWFVVGFSGDLRAGEVKTVHYFGQDIVLFRGEGGQAHALDPFCPHLGAHLGVESSVVGETLRCPFHGWQFGGDGRCKHIPYAERIPKLANELKSWPLVEQNNQLFVWYHPDGDPPCFEVPLLDETAWTEDKTVTWRVRTHPQEVFENTVDTAHLNPIHDVTDAHLIRDPLIENQMMNVYLGFNAAGDVVGVEGLVVKVRLNVTMHGIGTLCAQTEVPDFGITARQRIYPTPVDGETIDLRGVVNVKKSADSAWTAALAEQMYKAYVYDFARDFPIWEHKIYTMPPALAAGDGPVGLYRKWAKQFYLEPKDGKRLAPIAVPTVGRAMEGDAVIDYRQQAVSKPSANAVPGATARKVERSPQALPTTATDQRHNKTTKRMRPVTAPMRAGIVAGRISHIAQYLETLPARFVAAAAVGIDAVFQWDLTGADAVVFHVVIRAQTMQLKLGPHAAPTVCISMATSDFVDVVNGDQNGAQLFSSGRGKLAGDIMLAMKLQNILPA